MLERNVAPATHKQALYALVFLHRAVFEHGDFIIDTPNACVEFPWSFLFPASKLCAHPKTGKYARYHLLEDPMQRQMKKALQQTKITKRITCHTLRHYAALPEMPSQDN